MIVKLLANQIPTFWESIKFCTFKVNEITDDISPVYFNELLHSLLSDNSQCFVRLDDDRMLSSLMITKININKLTGKKSINILCLYSFKRALKEEWLEDFKTIRNFADSLKCKSITFETNSEKVMELGRSMGFKDVKKSFILDLGGM